MSLSCSNIDIEIPINIQKSRIFPFRSIELHVPLEVSKGCAASCRDEAGSRHFSRICTGDSDVPSSCERKYEPAFKSLHGNPAFFRVWASLGPLHLTQQTPGPSHIPVAERRLLSRGLWKVGVTFEFKRGTKLSSRDDLRYLELSSSCCAGLGVPLDLVRCFQGFAGVA